MTPTDAAARDDAGRAPAVDATLAADSAPLADARATAERPLTPDAPPAPPPPAGTVPMFVAAGMGGRTVVSCDDGKTWVGDHRYESSNADHSAYAHKGLAWGQGTFMVLLAWGADASIKVSDDGVTWRRQVYPGSFFGGLTFARGAFVIARQEQARYSRDQGRTWILSKPTSGGDIREGGGGGDETQGAAAGGGSGKPTWMSWDGGMSWKEAAACGAGDFGGIGQSGGMAFGGGALVIVSQDGASCRVSDEGKTAARGNVGGKVPGKLTWTGDRFWAIAGTKGYVSPTGAEWTPVTFKPAGVALQAIARGASGTYVGVGPNGADFWRSADGIEWQKATGPSGPNLVRVVFGYGKPSPACPGR